MILVRPVALALATNVTGDETVAPFLGEETVTPANAATVMALSKVGNARRMLAFRKLRQMDSASWRTLLTTHSHSLRGLTEFAPIGMALVSRRFDSRNLRFAD